MHRDDREPSAPSLMTLATLSTVVRSTEQMSVDLGTDVIILSLRGGVYYSLQGVAGRIWELLEHPRSVAELTDAITREYAVDLSVCEHDLHAFLADLLSHGLINRTRVGSPSTPR